MQNTVSTITNNKRTQKAVIKLSQDESIFKADRHASERELLKDDYMFQCGMSEEEAERAVKNCFAYEDGLLN